MRLPPALFFALAHWFVSVQTQPANNQYCNSSAPIVSFPYSLVGDASSSVPKVNYENVCRPFGEPELWYEFQGDGNCYAVSVEAAAHVSEGQYPVTSFGLMASMSGSCDDLECQEVQTSYFQDGLFTSFVTAEGVWYCFAISCSISGGNQTSFRGEIKQTSCTGLCSRAMNITSLPATVSGNNGLAEPTNDYGVSTCDVASSNRLEYFQYTGRGTCITAQVNAELFTPAILIYTGPCNELRCYDKSYNIRWADLDLVQQGRLLTWFAAVGTEYTIAVTGTDAVAGVGDFALTMMETECPPPPVNDVCERAQRISEVPTTINANLTLVPPVVEDQVSNCTSLTFSNSRAGLWYEFVGDGGCYEAKTARIVSDAKVAVFEGSCDEPLCVSDSFGSSVDFRAKEGVIYKILASGDGYRGEMALELVYGNYCSAAVPADNDECVSAKVIESIPFVDMGETIGATEDGNATVGGACQILDSRSKMMWYEMVGDGSCLGVSAEGSSYDVGVEIYTGANLDSCTDLQCAGSFYASPFDNGTQAILPLQTQPGVRYKVALGGAYSGAQGTYFLNITSSDICPYIPKCTICFDGSSPDEDLTYQDISCKDLDTELAGDPSGSFTCTLFQQIGVSYCNCPVPGDVETCNVCGVDGQLPQTPDATLSDEIDEPICNDLISAPALNDNTCQLVAAYAADCGCSAPASCSLCPDGALPNRPSLIVPYVFGELRTCADWAARIKAQVFPECDDLLPGFAISSFCCPRQEPARFCPLCGQNDTVADVDAEIPGLSDAFNVTCGQLLDAVDFITTQEHCDRVAEASAFCCSPFQTTEPTFPLTGSPVAIPADQTSSPTPSPAVPPTAQASDPTSSTTNPTEEPDETSNGETAESRHSFYIVCSLIATLVVTSL